MKPKNFPGHKNQRRLTVFSHVKMTPELPQDIKNLIKKLVSKEVARSIRTKKYRIKPS